MDTEQEPLTVQPQSGVAENPHGTGICISSSQGIIPQDATVTAAAVPQEGSPTSTLQGTKPRRNDTRPYSYRPLEAESSIRLLTLLPTTNADSPIECTLTQHTLNANSGDTVIYKALSYTWGDPALEHLIYVDGTPTPVTKNLYIALLHLRAIGLCNPWWIDAICINQEDVRERSHQVSMMRSIFRSASETVSWLGPASDDSDLVMDLLGRLGRELGSLEDNPEDILVDVSGTVHTAMQESQRLAAAIWKFLDRSYWKRVWVVQELVVPVGLRVLCGGKQARWHAVAALFDALMHDNIYASHSGDQQSAALLVQSRVILRRAYAGAVDAPTTAPDELSLGQLVSLTRLMAATEPRDRVFALLGIVMSGHGHEIMVDYDASLCSVFCGAIRIMYQDEREGIGFWGAGQEVLQWWDSEGKDAIAARCQHRPLELEVVERVGCDGISCGAQDLLVKVPILRRWIEEGVD